MQLRIVGTSATNAARELLQNRECTLSWEKNFCSYALRKGRAGRQARVMLRETACIRRHADAAADRNRVSDITASAISNERFRARNMEERGFVVRNTMISG